MKEAAVSETKRTAFSAADASVEAAVRRLVEAGMTRKVALGTIDKTLYEVIGKLGSAGIGGLSWLRQMNLSAGMKLNALMVDEANEEDSRYE